MEGRADSGQQPRESGDTRVATDTFRAFASRLTDGDESAAEELLARYSARLLHLARKHIGKRFAAKVDPEDAVQSVLRTFFHRVREGTVELRDWAGLGGLLSLLVLRKCAAYANELLRQKKDVTREVPLDDGEGRGPAILDCEPGPDEVMAFVDLVEHLLSILPEPDRSVVEGLIADESIRDLAIRLDRPERAIYRALDRIGEKLLTGPIAKDFGLQPRHKNRRKRNTKSSSD